MWRLFLTTPQDILEPTQTYLSLVKAEDDFYPLQQYCENQTHLELSDNIFLKEGPLLFMDQSCICDADADVSLLRVKRGQKFG